MVFNSIKYFVGFTLYGRANTWMVNCSSEELLVYKVKQSLCFLNSFSSFENTFHSRVKCSQWTIFFFFFLGCKKFFYATILVINRCSSSHLLMVSYYLYVNEQVPLPATRMRKRRKIWNGR